MGDKNTATTSDKNMAEIDKALKAAKNRKAAKQAAGTTEGTTATAPAEKVIKPLKPKMSDEEKAAKLAQRETERAAKKAQRDADRAAKIAERNANRAPAHMKKVQKAAEKLSPLGQAAELLFNEATANLPASDLSALAAHIQHFNRVKSTERAASQKLESGQSVTITGGDPRFIGKTGTLTKVQRIRCYVNIGASKDVYLFTSDVQLDAAPAAAATA